MPSSDKNSEGQSKSEHSLLGESWFYDEEQAEEHDETEKPVGKMTRAKLARMLGDRLGVSHELCDAVVLSFFETIKQALKAGETVKIQNFATFGIRSKSSRPGRNPKTGEEVEISARRVISFRASRELRRHIDSREPDGSS